eukprot:CAMPEP_0183376670 /NCGR_PEP_ID=MMETSP0164_2-20130417/120957_1 /TAXON_ID=221442 /ORGANISM="Coccolithus pelagicus ssp braarudi, Strain PLY182g" /LENGTH=78 /DNA_ID=CAMNT_0025554023 /DNA_START=15 /DNA_END=248 /DNA_ORIENTATION=-
MEVSGAWWVITHLAIAIVTQGTGRTRQWLMPQGGAAQGGRRFSPAHPLPTCDKTCYPPVTKPAIHLWPACRRLDNGDD